MVTPPVQDFPPPGGFPNTIKYARNLPRRGPSGAVVLAAVFGLMTYGFIKTGEGNAERSLAFCFECSSNIKKPTTVQSIPNSVLMDDRELRREKTWARIHLVPLLEAELDRDLVRRDALVSSREAEIMKGKPDWAAADLKAPVKGVGKYGVLEEGAAEPVYHTKRYVKPSLVFLPPNNDNVLDAQWWRGSKILTKNPPYQDRSDFSKEHPIGE